MRIKLKSRSLFLWLFGVAALSSAHGHQAIDPAIVAQIPARGTRCYLPNGNPTPECIEKGRQLFEAGTFAGNGRTCATCHPAINNFTIDKPYIDRLPPTDPLFVFETNPELSRLETSLLRSDGLICENLDGFGTLGDDVNGNRTCVLRSVPHTLGLKFSTIPDQGNFDKVDRNPPARPAFPLAAALGWGGDGSPGDGSLRNFAVGAVVQHFTRTLRRQAGVDFVLPTADELDAMEAFQFSLGRQAEMNLNPDPTGSNALFNCASHTPGCPSSTETFELQFVSSPPPTAANNQTPVNIRFTDPNVTAGQMLFFGGMQTISVPGASNIRSCSGCHVQAGAGSPYVVNTPPPFGNRNRATGAEQSPKSPVCLINGGEVFNADGGFGAGEKGFPLINDANGNLAVQDCVPRGASVAFPFATCFKTFLAANAEKGPTDPPFCNPAYTTSDCVAFTATASSMAADVGVEQRRLTAAGRPLNRQNLCNTQGRLGAIYFTGTSFFNTPSLIEAASTSPFFHNNIAATVEEAVAFYASDAFKTSASGAGRAFLFQDGQVNQVGAFLRAINALDSESSAESYLQSAISDSSSRYPVKIQLAIHKIDDAIGVLTPASASNRLGGPSSLFTNVGATNGVNVVQSFAAAKARLTANGSDLAVLQNLVSSDLNAAIGLLKNARIGMLKQ